METSRLIVRPGRVRDIPAILSYLKRNREFHAPYGPLPTPEYFQRTFWMGRLRLDREMVREDRAYRFFIFKKNKDPKLENVIGMMNFNNIIRGAFQACHLGYMLDEKEQGKGYMTEALTAGIEEMFTRKNLHRIMANYLPGNFRSARVLEKSGFVQEGLAKDYLLIEGRWQDHILTSLVNSRWKAI